MSQAPPSSDLVPVSEERLDDLIEAGDAAACTEMIDAQTPADAVRLITRLDGDERTKLLAMLEPEDATEVLEQMPEPQAVAAMADLQPETAARILEELPSAERADLVGQLDDEDAEAILARLDDDDAEGVRRLMAYPTDVAGGLMITEYLEYDGGLTVRNVIDDLGEHAERYGDYDIQYAYVTESGGRLIGVLRMRDLLLAPRGGHIRDLMIPDPLSVRDDAALAELAIVFEEHRFFGFPVVDADDRLCGVLLRDAVEEALGEASDDVYRRSQGIVGGEELRSMPLALRSRRRLSWLSVNIVLNIAAASVIALHQDTLEAVIALAVFLPIISDMSGCSGNQAVAVSMRELTLGVARPGDVFRVVWAELKVGMINGLALGILLGLVAFAWKGNAWLGLVVGGSLGLNTMIAVCIGGGVPLLLKRLKLDPALAAGPILTTVTDLCGFLLVLTFASLMLSRLT